jgi:hypothetical protein
MASLDAEREALHDIIYPKFENAGFLGLRANFVNVPEKGYSPLSKTGHKSCPICLGMASSDPERGA